MKSTLLKISVSQDGLLPQETAEIATLEFPTLPKKLLNALGFERVDSKTYVGVLPVFINLGEKEQEIEIELGVTLPEMRKKIIDIVKTPARLISVANEKKAEDTKTTKRKTATKAETAEVIKSAVTAKKATAAKKATTAKKAPAAKKASPAKPKAEPKTTSKTKTKTPKTAATKATAKTKTKATTSKAKRAKKG
ncbi:MAG: hypothetical protein DHS20C13_09600 [Thermodesulfobacteriota bacterium]|nr:MAG: hypothetical protein DHS20C13_09600 [Thermodesulfobacteriota bacterium]